MTAPTFRRVAGWTLFTVLALVPDLVLATPPGDIDLDFGVAGLAVTDFNGDDYATSVAVQTDGKIVAAGQRNIVDDRDFALARYNADGSLDTSFGTGGKVTTDFSATTNVVEGLVIQPDDKIVAAGDRDFGFALARYTVGGTLDGTFGSGGKVVTPLGFSTSLRSLVLQPDGKLVVGGSRSDAAPGTVDFALARYESNGALDGTFGTGGIVIADFPAGRQDGIHALALQPDGMLVAAGASVVSAGDSTDFGLVRFDVDGNPDPLFGSGGFVTIDVSFADGAQSVAIQPDGKIIVGGESPDAIVLRLNPDGSLDGSFGLGGIVELGFSPLRSIHDVIVDPDGGILLAVGDGAAFNETVQETILLRLRSDGSIDPTFGVDGQVTTAVSSGFFETANIALQPDGKVVLVGFTGEPRDFAVTRYEAGHVLACAASPLVGCKPPSSPHGAKLRILDYEDDGRDTLIWKLGKSSATTFGELGDPLTTDHYTLCAYDESGPPMLLLDASVPAGGLCDSRPCWRLRGDSGVGYKDDARTPLGVAQLDLKAGADGRAKMALRGRGANLPLPPLPLSTPLRVQLQSASGTCWESVFSAGGVRVNTTKEFKARTD